MTAYHAHCLHEGISVSYGGSFLLAILPSSPSACLAALPVFVLHPRVVGYRYEIWLPVSGRHTGSNCWVLFFYKRFASPGHALMMRMH